MGRDLPKGMGDFYGEGHARRYSDLSFTKTDEPIEMPFGLWTGMGLRKHALGKGQINNAKGQFLGKRTCPGMPGDTLP